MAWYEGAAVTNLLGVVLTYFRIPVAPMMAHVIIVGRYQLASRLWHELLASGCCSCGESHDEGFKIFGAFVMDKTACLGELRLVLSEVSVCVLTRQRVVTFRNLGSVGHRGNAISPSHGNCSCDKEAVFNDVADSHMGRGNSRI